jgi:multimeric flavodoxin WrbA
MSHGLNPPGKLLLMMGSPVKNGTIAHMLGILDERAKKLRWKTEWFDIYGARLAPCMACMSCRRTGNCVMADDLQPLVEKILSCDCVALGAPTYFSNVPGPVKTLFDRLAGSLTDGSDGVRAVPKLEKRA